MGSYSTAGYPSIKLTGTHLYVRVERGTVGVKCLDQEHNAVSCPVFRPGLLDLETSALSIRLYPILINNHFGNFVGL